MGGVMVISNMRHVICAWDFAIWLYQNTTLTADEIKEVTIPAVYITMQQAMEFLDLMNGVSSNNDGGGDINNSGDPIVLSMYARDRPSVNSSAIIIWALGVFVAWMKSHLVARAGGVGAVAATTAAGGQGGENVERPPPSPARHDGTPRSRSQSREWSTTATAASPPSESGERTIYRDDDEDAAEAVITNRNVQPQHYQEEESLELDASHAIFFIVLASTSLLVLFFFKIFNVVKIFYAFGCSGAFAQVVLYPLLTRVFRKLRWKSPMRPMECLSEENATHVFGACMCITFLGTIKINAIRVAAILLTVTFFYDIFFVFVTPLLTKHGESIMVNVATSGGPPKADPSWCEKYPSSTECKGGRGVHVGTWGYCPSGLLLSFASRFDEAKRLMGLVSGGAGRVRNGAGGVSSNKSSWNICCGCGQGGYFGPVVVVVAYAVGLAMANAAVYLMQMGQPALNGELNDIWDNPRAIRAADALLFGGRIEAEDEDDVRASSLLMNEGAEMT
ncbi:signal peptide peptidase [Skeletonema marinoi]|uniref:Signal peptide peptidase n=1 Tax=Skeletonema marinoi TaxID=267567 RepID=A0AAD8YCG0_9STRA|nr:signal peptide peptidase [Skeletonema marinoi]